MMNKRQTLGIVFVVLCFTLYGVLSVSQAINKDKLITLERAQEINYIFEQYMRGEIELTDQELSDLIKEYQKPIREVKE